MKAKIIKSHVPHFVKGYLVFVDQALVTTIYAKVEEFRNSGTKEFIGAIA